MGRFRGGPEVRPAEDSRSSGRTGCCAVSVGRAAAEDLGKLPLKGISWVIVGGESGPGARPMKEEWVLSIREQCEAANVPFFFKQWGGVRKKTAGRTLSRSNV